MKKKIIITGIVIVILLVIGTLYSTFASSSTITEDSDNEYTLTLTDSKTSVLVPANSSKTIIYKILNTNPGAVSYGVGYSGTNINVKLYDNSEDEASGIIDYRGYKYVKLYVENRGDTDSTAVISTVLGYEFGGDLIVPEGTTLVTEIYTYEPPYTGPISGLFTKLYSPTKTAVNNGITYNQDANNYLMEDIAGNVRYYGAEPNNYIYFNCEAYPDTNCEMWRIIGLFKDVDVVQSDGTTVKQDLVKIIRDESIGNLAWDQDKNIDSSVTTYSNSWYDETSLISVKNSSLNLFLNGPYYNRGTTKTLTYYSGIDGATESILDLTTIGLKNDATREKIANVLWYLGGWNVTIIYANDVYTYERTNNSETIYSGNPFTSKGYIGLMYSSDYAYATDLELCQSGIRTYNEAGCYDNDWLHNNAYQWVITPYSSHHYFGWVVCSDGHVGVDSNFYGPYYGIRPVLYLNSETIIEPDGNGSEGSPYKISAD